MELQWKALLTQVVGFLIVLWLLRKYAWDKLLAFIEKRRETIAAEFESIERTRADADALRRKYDEELAGIEATRRARIQEAAHEASGIAGKIRDEARQEAVDMRVKATQDIGMEMDKANATFRDQMVDAVLTATEKLIRQRLDDAQHRRLINEYLDEVANRPAGR
ncbi:MAG: F0F1 ATP synthase subunit B [Candidatus Krumholzibacteria bacterium]|nr:F0F1 ATP synthase subunit B [Candidatus Krumholzibacteria bacterium]MDH4337452.1 F0F1 ATP synthase subunit B [Candidatus Krumholzibacteria bacterium]MDH5270168.1 F0F1 ATP synthase subunit B [Candidatus Krumholzibacteria bacterium]